MTAIHITKFIIKLLLFIAVLPFLLLIMLVKYLRYEAVLIRNLESSGVPGHSAKALAKETRLTKMFTKEASLI